MPTIQVYIGERVQTVQTKAGETLHEALSRYGIYHTAPCGGQKLCKHCKIIVRGQLAPPQKQEAEFLTDQELLKGVRYCCMAVPTGDCQVYIEETSLWRQEPNETASCLPTQGNHGYACGIDIGTTTLAVYLYSRKTGQTLAVESAQNKQSVFGDDVISRIQAANTMRALPRLQQSVQHQLTQMITSACQTAHITPQEIKQCAIAANTTMLHLLAGLDPAGIAVAPFTPLSLFGTMYRGEQLGLPLACEVYLIPCISAYVGGDITAGIVACDMDRTDQTVLLIDVGTNGEMALCHNGSLHCLATAAGPAFEGAHIQCGTGGVAGAVCQIDEQGYQTVGNADPIGICGSGLIDAIAMMLRKEALDETGYLEEDFNLIPNAKLVITPKDIREIQLAKSAICSGVMRLCELAHIAPEDIDRVCFAGGFGSHMNPRHAAAIGLIPANLADKCISAGNTAGRGAGLAALSEEAIARMETVAQYAQYFELSGDARFNELFMENMMFEG